MAAKVRSGEQFEMCGETNMTAGKELHKKVRDAIFLAALGNWEESCMFEELSADGQQVYEDYATVALEACLPEMEALREQVRAMAAQIEAAIAERSAETGRISPNSEADA